MSVKEGHKEYFLGIQIPQYFIPDPIVTLELASLWKNKIEKKNKCADESEREMMRTTTNNRKPLIMKEIIKKFLQEKGISPETFSVRYKAN